MLACLTEIMVECTLNEKVSKLKHQVKSNMYYVFWGACTFAVMAGQIYVGTGYRSQCLNLLTFLIKLISIDQELCQR